MEAAQVREQRRLKVRELAAQITELTGHMNAANYRWLSLIAEFDRLQGWSDGSTSSCAHWLNIWTPPALQGRIRFRIQEGLHKYIRPSVASVDAGPDDSRSQEPRYWRGVRHRLNHQACPATV